MLTDVTGTVLIPGNMGRDCPGNGSDPEVECCCDECDYMLCCLEGWRPGDCLTCTDLECPQNNCKR